MTGYYKKNDGWKGCACSLVLLALNITLGTVSTNYLLMFFLGKTVPVLWAVVIGVIGGEVIIPVAAVVWILRFVGIL